ncbi:saccharopine dehydrogenase NADP-binding domain-containing protein, partial [Frankia sp. CcWB2]
MTARIVVFGATGYTGRLVTAELVAVGHRPVLAGRTETRVRALAAAYDGLGTAVVDATTPAGVADAADRTKARGAPSGASLARLLGLGTGDVLVSTVGPFRRFGRPVVAAAAAVGAHYLDCSGEGAFLRHVFTEVGPRAAASGAALIPGAGFDFVPGNLAGALALQAAGGEARRLDIGYLVTGALGMSSGTRATLLAALTEPVIVLRGGVLVERPLAREVRSFRSSGKVTGGSGGRRGHPAVLWSGGEPFTLPRLAPALTDVATYIGGVDRGIRVGQALSFPLSGLRRFPPGRALLAAAARSALRTTGRGPDRAARARAGA